MLPNLITYLLISFIVVNTGVESFEHAISFWERAVDDLLSGEYDGMEETVSKCFLFALKEYYFGRWKHVVNSHEFEQAVNNMSAKLEIRQYKVV